MNNQFTHPKERIRFAILTFFFAQGLCMASWASRIPDFKDVFAANYAFYWGLILFMIPVGKFVAIPLAGYLVSKLGSRSMVQVSILGYASSLLCIGLAHEVYLLGFLLFCFGVCWNLCDISFNTQGIEVERIYGKTIMATFHGGWSLGACAGALIGFVMILAGVSPIWHYTLIFIIILIIALSGRKYLQESASQETEVSDTKTQERNAAKAPNGFRLLFQKPEMLLLQLGLVGLFALIVESAMFDWSAVYFESVVHVPKSLQIGFLVFMIMMATGRFLTNYATGVHAGGVVISDNRDINEYIPIYYNHSLDVWAVQCDMVRLEEKGFLKFDLLGLKNLDIITDTLYLILKHTGSAVDINTIPFEDVVFSGIYSTGRTNSVFQFESAGMKKMLQRFQPSCFEDIILLVAAYRPGPMQYLDDIIAVKQGTKPIHYDIPELEPILSETYGAVIYQEQVMRIFQDLAGYSLGGADLVRRAMSKKKMDKLKKERKAFLYGDKERGICGCLSKGIPEAKADALFDSLMDFAKYAFNKSHAAAYALVSYQTAWLKHHYPDCFACAMLNNTEQKDYAPIIEDCRARGVRILPPSILQSHYDCTIENGAIRLGMRSIKGVAEKTAGFIDQIKSARGSGQLHSFSDFLSCCISEEDGKVIQPPAALVEKMISVGVFDIFYKNRQGLLQAYQEIRKRISSTKGENRMEKVNLIIQFFSVPAWDIPDKKWNMQAELEYLGDVYSESPVSGFAPPQYYGCIPFSQMHPGKNKIMGYICNIEEKVSRKGTPIYILSLFDGKEYLSIIGLQKYFPQLSDYLFLPVSMQVKKGEKGFFLENVRILQKTNQKNETSFICDTMEKQQYLQDILSEDHFAAPAEKYCTLHILRFPHGTDDVVRNVPVVVTVNLTEKAYGQVTQKKWYSK